MSKKFTHSKKRNTGLLYEFLIRHISDCLSKNKKDEAMATSSIIKKHFCVGTCLNDELKLYKAVIDGKVKSRESANKILCEIFRQSNNINIGQLNEEKSKLIKEINYSFNAEEIYNYKVPEYQIYASLHILMNDKRGKKPINEQFSKIKLEDNIINYLTTNTDIVSEKVKLDPRYDDVVYKFVIQKFHDKYSKQLSENQRKLITKYVVCSISENDSVFKSTLLQESKLIKENLRTIIDENLNKDVELVKKINECYKKFVSTNFEEINEDKMIEFLEYMSLLNEINSKE